MIRPSVDCGLCERTPAGMLVAQSECDWTFIGRGYWRQSVRSPNRWRLGDRLPIGEIDLLRVCVSACPCVCVSLISSIYYMEPGRLGRRGKADLFSPITQQKLALPLSRWTRNLNRSNSPIWEGWQAPHAPSIQLTTTKRKCLAGLTRHAQRRA